MKKIGKVATLIFFSFASLSIGHAENLEENNVPDNVIEINKDTFLKKVFNYEKNGSNWVYEGSTPCIVNFYANWCGPCKRFYPTLTEIAREYGDKIIIYRINTETERELAAVFGVRGIPLTVFIPLKGAPQAASGALPKESLKEIVDSFLLK